MHPLFHISDRGLKQNAQRASVLNFVGRGIEFFLQFVTLTILARLLTPADFGVFAMATAFVWIIMNFGDLGLAAAVLQQRDLNEEQASAVFQVNLWAGLAFGGLFFLSSPLLGSFYGDPRVTQVAAALSLTFVFSGLTAVQRALLRRALLFGALLRAQIAASVISSVLAVLLALEGAGYWALTARALAEPLVYTIVVWISAGWLPVGAKWDDTTKALLRYGRYCVGSSLLSAFGAQADKVLIGWRFGSAELGLYALAYRLFLFPVQQVSFPLGHVIIPAFSRIRDDPDRLKRWYSKLVRLVTFVSFPPLFSLVICADDVVYVIAGPQWGNAADILRLLALVGAIYVVCGPAEWLMRSRGQADRAFRWAVFYNTICLVCVVLGLSWGAIGVAAGLASANLLLVVPGLVYAAKGTSIRLSDVFKAMFPCLVITALTVSSVWALRIFIAQDWHPLVRFTVTGAIIAIIMTIGAVSVYGRSVLPHRLLKSELT